MDIIALLLLTQSGMLNGGNQYATKADLAETNARVLALENGLSDLKTEVAETPSKTVALMMQQCGLVQQPAQQPAQQTQP